MLHGRENFGEKKIRSFVLPLPELRDIGSLNAYKEQCRTI